MMASVRTAATSSDVISGSGLAMAKMIGFSAIDFTMSCVTAPFTERPKKTSAPTRPRRACGLGLDRIAGFPLVHAFGAAFVDDALGVAENEVFRAESRWRCKSSRQAMPAAPAPLQTSLVVVDLAAGQLQRVDQAGCGDDGRTVLIVMEHRECRAARAAAAR